MLPRQLSLFQPSDLTGGPGALPAPVPSRGFSTGQIVALSSPPTSVTITAGLADGIPRWTEDESPGESPDGAREAIQLPERLHKDIIDTLAALDSDVTKFQLDHTKNYANYTGINLMLEDVQKNVYELNTQLKDGRLALIESRLDSLLDASNATAEVMAEASPLRHNRYDSISVTPRTRSQRKAGVLWGAHPFPCTKQASIQPRPPLGVGVCFGNPHDQ